MLTVVCRPTFRRMCLLACCAMMSCEVVGFAQTKPSSGSPARNSPPQGSNPAAAEVSGASDAAEKAVRESAQQFVDAYNRHDAAAIGAMFLPAAQIIDEADNTVEGREAIQAVFDEVFQAFPETKVEVRIESIRMIGRSLAVETGTTSTLRSPNEPAETARYSVVHVLTDGKWLMGLVRDIPSEPTHRDHLQALSWLVGDWIDESETGKVRTQASWSKDGSFLLQEITVTRADQEVIRVSQRIGWDPLRKQFRSWMFDSEGGYGESFWTPTESGWLIKATSVNSDGTTSSATNHIQPLSLDRFLFLSVDRVTGNEVLPNAEVVVVRQPPRPADSENASE